MKFNEHKKIMQMQLAIELTLKSLKDEVGEMAVRHFKKSFDIEGFNDTPTPMWKSLKRPRPAPYTGNKILTRTGSLKKSLRYKSRVGKRTWSVSVNSPLIYANVHNEGLRSGRGKGFKMPKRQFMGESSTLDHRIQTRINNRIKAATR